jgi:hypothetical protein
MSYGRVIIHFHTNTQTKDEKEERRFKGKVKNIQYCSYTVKISKKPLKRF